jgi:hypothetical protein
LTNIWFKGDIRDKFPEFSITNLKIKEVQIIINTSTIIDYQFKPPLLNKNNILFFISPCEDSIFDVNYYNITIIELLTLLKEIGYKISIKGHPRLATPSSIEEMADFIIPNYVPGEFINLNHYTICLGVNTFLMAYYSKFKTIPIFSLINLFPASNALRFKVAIDYLIQQSNNEIKFCNSKNELQDIVLKLKTYVKD